MDTEQPTSSHSLGTWVYYACSPIDWWAGWLSLGRVPMVGDDDAYDAGYPPTKLLRAAVAQAADAFSGLGWEGVGHWYCAGFPDPANTGISFCIACKQENNGTTFIAVPRVVHWLWEDCHHAMRIDEKGKREMYRT